ncbi:hypothetical protein VOLCADRAFT_87045 [Volvox carteri f. nagariensis]|uniref:FAS1 domain-containing protein n=1 Tax=Volvox carteri f. nagariensis TaxID=3068 RepID=D8TK11_VOLCA|nr:uncharacterized protein VOLCADRAFT_87045 [Volvox carteri f. nagariensis]EFJ51982.1 hypothetical protein VOLCADRAFT_87045 [Volvox carteri f. nagariensis]|eukprot:XP_002946756.1 hypothetical protein VOLCADRAFT_87045 [Volvox carteri f. nagariensis]
MSSCGLLVKGEVLGNSNKPARISLGFRVCGSYLYFVSYVLLPGPSLEALPPFQEFSGPVVFPAAAAAAAAAAGGAAAGGAKPCNPKGTILDALRSTPDLSYMLSAIDTPRLTLLFNNASTELTLLAPNDEAWREGALRMNLGTPEDILGQSWNNLRALVWAHTIAQNLPPTKLQSQLYTTMGPSAGPVSVTVSSDSITVTNANTADARVVAMGLGDACTGSLYILNRMLLPQQLPEPLKVLPVPSDKKK